MISRVVIGSRHACNLDCSCDHSSILTPVLVACCTNAREVLLKSSQALTYLDVRWMSGEIVYVIVCYYGTLLSGQHWVVSVMFSV